MNSSRRSLLTGSLGMAAAGLFASVGLAQPDRRRLRRFTPEMFGAKGDGATNDTAAMAALAGAVNAEGGGLVEFRRTTYLVGGQSRAERADIPASFPPHRLLEFAGCTKPLILRGNGARLRCEGGLRYGIFERTTGAPKHHPMPYVGTGGASPYEYMVKVERCSGPVEVSELELDGNVDGLVIGGQYGDTGWQIAAIGLALVDNSGPEIVRRVHTHHHALDGLLINGLDAELERLPERRITELHSEYNGRQGCSITGGRGYKFERCRFNRTGRARVSSMPGAGVDIEAEGGKRNRDFEFEDCEFVDNVGCGLVADTGDSEGALFRRCTFVGTTNWSAWPFKPRFRFERCRFTGALVRAYGDWDPHRAAQFIDCSFTDDPRLSPSGRVYGGSNPDRPLADLSDAPNMLFSKCSFLARHDGTLPWSVGAIYEDCVMEQKSPARSYPRGTYRGRTIINGNVDLSGSRIVGELIVNGRRYAAAGG